jgi:hypothetical protein
VIRFLTLKGLKACVIRTEHESVYGPEVLARPTVRKWWTRFHQKRTDLFNHPRSGRPLTNDLAGTIGCVLEEKLFSSCKMPCFHFQIGRTTWFGILHDKLGLKNLHLPWAPHALWIN